MDMRCVDADTPDNKIKMINETLLKGDRPKALDKLPCINKPRQFAGHDGTLLQNIIIRLKKENN